MQSFRATSYCANDWGIIFDEVEPLLKPYSINPKESNFLADLLVWAADINEYVYCRSYNSNGLMSDISFSFGYDVTESILQAISQSLNTKFAGMNARYIAQNFEYIHYIDQEHVPSKTIKVNFSVFQQHILPLIPEFLTLQKDSLQKYEFEYLKMDTELKAFFEKYGICITETDCFEELLCYIAKTKVEIANEIFKALPTDIPTVLIDMINAYSFAVQSTVEPSTIATTKSMFRTALSTDMKTEVFVEAPYHSAKNIATFFNLIRPGASEVEEKEVFSPQKSAHLTKITITNDAIKNPLFFSEATAALALYSSDKLQAYRDASKLLDDRYTSLVSKFNSIWQEKKSYFYFMPWIKSSLKPAMDNLISFLQNTSSNSLSNSERREILASHFARFVAPVRDNFNIAKINLADIHIAPLATSLDEIEKILQTKFVGEQEISESSSPRPIKKLG